jgi:HEAT repeat protein
MRRSVTAFLLVACLATSLAAEPPAPAPPAPAPATTDVDALAKDLASADVDTRRKAAYALWGLADKAAPALPALAGALADDDEYVRTTAEKTFLNVALFAGGRPAIWNPTFAVLRAHLKDARPAMRRAAAMGLWSIGVVPESAEGLAETALGMLADDDADLRANGAGILANVSSWLTPALQPLRDKAMSLLLPRAEDEDDRVRRAVADALGALGMPDGIEALFTLAKDPEAKVRAAALPALGGMPASGYESARRLDVLRAALFEAEASVRVSAANTLWAQRVNAGDAVPELLKALRDDKEASVRAPAVSALGATGDKAAHAAVRRAVDDPDVSVRAAAVNALADFGPEAGAYLPLLVNLLRGGGDPLLRSSAAMTLGRLGHVAAPAVPALIRALSDEVQEMRMLAANALHALALAEALPEEVLPALFGHLLSASPGVSESMAYLFAAFPSLPAAAGPALRRAYASARHDNARAALVQALARVDGPSEETLVLLRPLAEGDDELAPRAALGLVRQGTPADRARGLAVLAAALDRTEAVQVFGLVGEAGSRARALVPALLQRLRSSETTAPARSSKFAAAMALVRIGGEGSGEAVDFLLRTLLGDPNLFAARNAAEALGRMDDPPPAVLDALVSRLRDPDAVGDVAVAAVVALRRLGCIDAETFELLARAAEHPRDGALRLAASHALLVLAGR